MQPPLDEDLLAKIRQQQEQLQLSRQPLNQPPVASPPPPNEATVTADAALLAAQQISQRNQETSAVREQESSQAMASLDEADRFEQNAAVAQQAAQESVALAQQQRQEADQLTQIHQQEEAAESQEEQFALEQAKSAEIDRVISDPAVFEQAKPDLAKALGVKPSDLDAEVQGTVKDLQDIAAGISDPSNQRQAALAKKINSGGKGLSKKESLGFGLMSLLPIIVGAATGQLGEGLQAASKLMASIPTKAPSGKATPPTKLGGAILDAPIDKEKPVLASFVSKDLDIPKEEMIKVKEIETTTTESLKKEGLRLSNAIKVEKLKKDKVATKKALVDFEGRVEALTGKPVKKEGAVKPDQRKVAGFAVRLAQAEDIFTGLEEKGFSPGEAGGWLPNRLISSDRQTFNQAKMNFARAFLRRVSGAAIGKDEFESAEVQYFPQPGDGAAVLAQKKLNRVAVMKAFYLDAGDTAMEELYDSLGDDRPTMSIEPIEREGDEGQQGAIDFSQMSDEELQRIIEGGQ